MSCYHSLAFSCKYLAILIAVLCTCSNVEASIYHPNGQAHGWKVTEKMFGKDNGPFNMKGESYVAVNSKITILPDYYKSSNSEYAVLLAVFYQRQSFVYTTNDLCHMNYSTVDSDAGYGQIFPLGDSSSNDSNANLSTKFIVKEKGQLVGLIQTCRKYRSNASIGDTLHYYEYKMGSPVLNISAEIVFRNPYGYLSGILYGFLPFSGVLALGYILLDIIYFFLFIRHRHSVIQLNYFILIVLFLATSENLCWYFTYDYLNESGTPVCCPYPTSLLASILFMVVSKMIARVLLLVISMGYGVVRPKLTRSEVVLVIALGFCYMISAMALKISEITQHAEGNSDPPAIWEILSISANTIFAAWIYSSLDETKNNLFQAKQTAKFAMYNKLFLILISFVAASVLFMLLEAGVYAHAIPVPWEWVWLLYAGSRCINFFLILAVTIIWRPSHTSQMYSLSSQLSTSEIDTDDIDMGVEMASRLDDDDDDTEQQNQHPQSL